MSVYKTPPIICYHRLLQKQTHCENKQLHYQLGDLDIFSAIRMTSSFIQKVTPRRLNKTATVMRYNREYE